MYSISGRTLREQIHPQGIEGVVDHAEAEDLGAIAGVTRAIVREREAELLVQGDLNPLLRRLASEEIEDLVFPEPELEDIFMALYREGHA